MRFEFHHGRRYTWEPHIDICERADEIVVLVEIPGVAKSDIQLSWSDGILVISGEKRAQAASGVLKHHCIERPYGQFRREIAIGIPVDREKARAELRDGLMRIYLPKKASSPKTGTIPIFEQE